MNTYLSEEQQRGLLLPQSLDDYQEPLYYFFDQNKGNLDHLFLPKTLSRLASPSLSKYDYPW